MKVFIILLWATFLVACNPLKQISSDIEKSDDLKDQLARLCAEKFPIPPIQYKDGKIDTAALIAEILKLCPGYNGAAPVYAISGDQIMFPVDGQTDTVKTKVVIQAQVINKDSLIRALKKFMAPDTVKIKDSAESRMLKSDLKKAFEQIGVLEKKNTALTISNSENLALARQRLWMFIAACVLSALFLAITVIIVIKKFRL